MTIPHAELALPPGVAIRRPPPWKPIPESVPVAIEAAAEAYLDCAHRADVTWTATKFMARDSAAFADVYSRWLELSRLARLAWVRLEDAVGGMRGTFPVCGGMWLVRNVVVPSGGCELRVEPGICPWPREKGEER